jgi:Zn-dependent protease with chaperone function
MNSISRATVLLALVCLCLPGIVPAQDSSTGSQRDPKFESEVLHRLGLISAEAVPIFEEATRALDVGDYESAQTGYERVIELAPDFPDAYRRLSYVKSRLGDHEAAVSLARRAHSMDPSPHNKLGLAAAILYLNDPVTNPQALELARDGAGDLPDDPWAQTVLLFAAVSNEDRDVVRSACEKLRELTPDSPLPYYYGGLIAAYDGDLTHARYLLEHSKELGMPAEDVDTALRALDEVGETGIPGWVGRGALGVVGWVALLLVLFLLGLILSKLTLVAVRRSGTTGQFDVGSGERWMRRVYGSVIAVTSLGFYLSIPILIFTVVAVTLAIGYLFLVLGTIPIKLAALIGFIAIATLIAVIRSIFARVADEDPGRPLARDEAPGLWDLTKEVADSLGTHPVDEIYVTPGSEVAVVERGGIRSKLQGRGRRCLILGLGALNGLYQNQFMPILAHEYGHFINRDTAGGNLANQVRLSIYHMGYGLAYNGLANWYNPAWLFVNGYYRVFLVITLGASRLQEILADRRAAMAYGARNFAEGLKQIIRQNIVFDAQVRREVRRSEVKNDKLHNVYTLPQFDESSTFVNVDEEFEAHMSHPASKYDSHPSPKERIELLAKFDAPASDDSRTALVWDLFSEPEKLQIEMTGHIQHNVDEHRMVTGQVQPETESEEE